MYVCVFILYYIKGKKQNKIDKLWGTCKKAYFYHFKGYLSVILWIKWIKGAVSKRPTKCELKSTKNMGYTIHCFEQYDT